MYVTEDLKKGRKAESLKRDVAFLSLWRFIEFSGLSMFLDEVGRRLQGIEDGLRGPKRDRVNG